MTSSSQANHVRLFRVFVASPGDVKPERERLQQEIDSLNRTLGRDKSLRLEAWRWERDALPGLGEPQELINPELDKSDVVIGILWNRLGTPTARALSGTEEEIARSIERWSQTRRPHVALFFCERAAMLKSVDDREQAVLVAKFRERVEPLGLHVAFETLEEFGQRARETLHGAVNALLGAAPPATENAMGRSKRPSFDREGYLRHVVQECGYVNLDALLGDRPAAPIPIEKIHVALHATRPRATRGDGSEPGMHDDVAFRQVADEWNSRDKHRDVSDSVIAAALRASGSSDVESRHPRAIAFVRSRLEEQGASVSVDAVREMCSTLEVDAAFRQFRGLLVEGDPGCGKTTTLAHLAMLFVAAQRGDREALERIGVDGESAIPVFVPLRHFRGWLAEHAPDSYQKDPALLTDFLRDTIEPHGGGEWLDEHLANGRLVLLLDGVDEIPENEHRERIAEIVVGFVHAHASNRFVVSSRPSGLTGKVGTKLSDIGGLAHCVVRPFDAEQVRAFVHAWFGVMEPNDGERARKTADLIERIERNRRVSELASSPIMLTAIAAVHATSGRLPERQADLYEHLVTAMAHRWDDAHDEFRRVLCGPISEGGKKRFLQRVAFEAHGQGENARVVRRSLLLEVARVEFDRDLKRELNESERAAHVNAMADRSGILIPDGPRDFRFRHLQFQEFLAARYVCSVPEDPARALQPYLGEPWWRQVVQLAPAFQAIQTDAPARRMLKDLGSYASSIASDRERAFALATLALAVGDLREYGVPGLGDVVAEWFPAILRLIESRSESVDDLELSTAAGLLAAFGSDPRLTEDRRWVSIPAGKFVMGTTRGRQSDEAPAHEVNVPAFELQRWPVTIAEYAEFLAANPGTDRPGDWENQQSSLERNAPATSMTWNEARQYCAWRTSQDDARGELRLPSEAEWEYACRAGSRGAYSFGDDETLQPRHAWIESNSGGCAHAVGLKRANPFGLFDMHGNVWEWCEDTYQRGYKDAPDDGSAWVVKASVGRVIRGGSYGHAAGLARSAFRGWHPPSGRWGLLGFRPARSVTT